jgi:hypothetical protein
MTSTGGLTGPADTGADGPPGLPGQARQTRSPGNSASGPPALSIDRLTLTVPQMSQADASRLAELVAEALRDWPTAPAASGRVTQVSTTITAPGPETGPPTRLATTIAEAVLAAALRELS